MLRRSRRIDLSREEFRRAHCLRGQHQKPALRRNPTRQRTENQIGTERVIDRVCDRFQCGKAVKLRRTGVGIRIHSDRRCVDENLHPRGMVAVKIRIGNAVLPRSAADPQNLPRPHRFRDRTGSQRSSARAENRNGFAPQGNADCFQKRFQPVKIGVIAAESAAPVDDRVDRADLPRRRIDLIQKRDHRLFVGKRDIDSAKVLFFQKSGQVCLLKFVQFIGVTAQHSVNLCRKAVSQLLSDTSVLHALPLSRLNSRFRTAP